MSERPIQNPPASETMRLIQIQSAMRVFAFLANAGALVICLSLIRHFRTEALRPSLLSASLFIISGLLILAGILFLILGWLERRKMEFESRSYLDERTGALVKQAFEKILTDEMRRAGRYHYPVTLCILHLDDLESVTDHFGPEKSEGMLRHFSELLRGTVRFSDTVGYTKEGFLVLLPHTDLIRAQKFLNRVLAETEERLDTGFSAGLTTYQAGERQAELLGRLELALRTAKREGKKKIRAVIPGQDAQAVLSL